MIEHFADYIVQLVRLSEEHTIAFKEEMQEAFEHGFKLPLMALWVNRWSIESRAMLASALPSRDRGRP